MKKLLIFTVYSLLFFGYVNAQEIKTVNFSDVELNQSQLLLSENWKTFIDKAHISISNGSIKNESSKNFRNLNLDLYLLPHGNDVVSNSFAAYHVTTVNFPSIRKNSSLAGINIKGELVQTPPNGLYDPVLVLSNKGKVVSIQKVEDVIEQNQGVFSFYSQPTQKAIATKSIANQTSDSKQTVDSNLNPVVKIDVVDDNSVSIDKEWKVDIDFKNFLVKLTGGDIANNTSENFNNLVLNVFLTDENQTKINADFNGLLIASADVEKAIEKHTRFVDATITTNLQQIPASGTYYILMTLSVKDSNGNLQVRSKRAFSDPVSF